MHNQHVISVIIPTTGLPAREKLLWRAIESVIGQRDVRGVPIVVLNGGNSNPGIEGRLRADPGIRFVRLEEASLPASLRLGRSKVDTHFFSELDDDDIFLPGALNLRVKALSDQPHYDVVVTNGYRRDPSGDILHIPDMGEVEQDPLLALTRGNWLLPGAWLCRTDRVDASAFDRVPPFRECTYLAFVFAGRFETLFLKEPTVVWHTGTPASASNTAEYMLAGPSALRRILEMDLPPDLRALLRRRMSRECHDAAEWCRTEGKIRAAWAAHLSSLRWPGGFRYLRYSGRLLLTPWRR
ncbi:MAG: glycosyltransferase family 2 protein [Gemmatimonadetes bacterium]|nr:glycosyltransferase family 2 protein [Gemmatimonadota bacterium]